MKRIITLITILCLMLASLMFVACSCNDDEDVKLELSVSSYTITVGEEFTIYGYTTSEDQIDYDTSNESIATVSATSDGGAIIKGVSVGEAKITAEVNGKKRTCKITVVQTRSAEDITITLSAYRLEVEAGKSVPLTATTNSSEPISWSTSATAVAVADGSIVKGINSGYAWISATIDDFTVRCLVYVTKPIFNVTMSTGGEFVFAKNFAFNEQALSYATTSITGEAENTAYAFKITEAPFELSEIVSISIESVKVSHTIDQTGIVTIPVAEIAELNKDVKTYSSLGLVVETSKGAFYKNNVKHYDYAITTADDFKTLMASAHTITGVMGLTNDIKDIKGYSNTNASNSFTGTLDGNGYVIDGLELTGYGIVGRFAGTIKNIVMTNVAHTNTVGGFISETATNCHLENVFIAGSTNAGRVINQLAEVSVGASFKNVIIIGTKGDGSYIDALARNYYDKSWNGQGSLRTTSAVEEITVENILFGDDAFFTNFEDGLPEQVGKAYEMKADGLYYNDKIVLRNMDAIEFTQKQGELYHGELYYFDKQATGDYQITLPENLGQITNAFIGSQAVQVKASSGSAITLSGDNVRTVSSGENTLLLLGGDSWYRYNVTLADYIVTNSTEFLTAMQASINREKQYVVIASDITATGEYNAHQTGSNAWGGCFISVLDGKGHVIDGLNITGNGLLGTYGQGSDSARGEIKNIAFTNVTASSYMIATYVGNITVQNAMFQGTANGMLSLLFDNNATLQTKFIDIALLLKKDGNYIANLGTARAGSNWESDYTLTESRGTVTVEDVLYATNTFYTPQQIEKLGADWTTSNNYLCFNGTPVLLDEQSSMATATAKTGSLYKGELYYFDKQATGDYEITLPENLGEITKVFLGGIEIPATYTSANNKLTLNGDNVRAIASGEAKLLLKVGDVWYYYSATIADQIIDSVSDFDTAMTKPSGYMIITTNLTGATSNNNSNTNGACSFTLDGKGHTITGLTIAANGLGGGLSTNQWTLSRFTIKNLAMSGIDGVDGAFPNKVLAECATGITLENVFFYGHGKNMGTMFNSTASLLKDVVIFLFNNDYRIKDFGTLYTTSWTNLGTITTETVDNFTVENVHYQTDNEASFFSTYTTTDSLPEAFNSEWTIETDGLYFNGTKVLAK